MAYSLSDLYIKETDKCTSIQQVTALHESMTFDFTDRMRLLDAGKRLTETIKNLLIIYMITFTVKLKSKS